MIFRIKGANHTGVLSITASTAIEAVKKAVELMGRGLSNVTITAPDGTVYTSAHFHLLVGKARS